MVSGSHFSRSDSPVSVEQVPHLGNLTESRLNVNPGSFHPFHDVASAASLWGRAVHDLLQSRNDFMHLRNGKPHTKDHFERTFDLRNHRNCPYAQCGLQFGTFPFWSKQPVSTCGTLDAQKYLSSWQASCHLFSIGSSGHVRLSFHFMKDDDTQHIPRITLI
jgi:hypothetical protein